MEKIEFRINKYQQDLNELKKQKEQLDVQKKDIPTDSYTTVVGQVPGFVATNFYRVDFKTGDIVMTDTTSETYQKRKELVNKRKKVNSKLNKLTEKVKGLNEANRTADSNYIDPQLRKDRANARKEMHAAWKVFLKSRADSDHDIWKEKKAKFESYS